MQSPEQTITLLVVGLSSNEGAYPAAMGKVSDRLLERLRFCSCSLSSSLQQNMTSLSKKFYKEKAQFIRLPMKKKQK